MEAAKLGFSHIIVPEIHAPAATGRLANIDIIKCRTIKDALMVSHERLAPQQRSPFIARLAHKMWMQPKVPCCDTFVFAASRLYSV